MTRREAREAILKILYEYDVGGKDVEDIIKNYNFENQEEYVINTLRGTMENLMTIDEIIEDYSLGWKLERMARVDLAILRFSLYEIIYQKDIPFNVTINEAIELAKKYSTEESPSFINGILGRYVEENCKEESKTDLDN